MLRIVQSWYGLDPFQDNKTQKTLRCLTPEWLLDKQFICTVKLELYEQENRKCIAMSWNGVLGCQELVQYGIGASREREVKGDEECLSAHALRLVINYSDRNITRSTLLAIHKHRECDSSKEK